MTRSFAAASNAIQTAYDPESPLILGPAQRQQLLAEAFARDSINEETTLRMTAPAMLAGIPSPLGDEPPPPSGERPTVRMPVFQPTVLAPTRARVLAMSGVALALLSALVLAVLAQ